MANNVKSAHSARRAAIGFDPMHRRSNQSVIATSALTFSNASAEADLRAYDQLPPVLRHALRTAPIDVSARDCLAEYRHSRQPEKLAAEIRDYLKKALNEDRAKQGLPPIQSQY
jgi:nitrate reductase cytochrome c-type subunit